MKTHTQSPLQRIRRVMDYHQKKVTIRKGVTQFTKKLLMKSLKRKNAHNRKY